MARTFNDIVASMKSFIRGKNSKLDTSEGTILNDVVISAPSQELTLLYQNVDTVAAEQSIETATDDGLARLAGNFGLTRKAARKARGTVNFFVNNSPTSDINIPAGTVVATSQSSNTNAVQFATVRAAIMYGVLAGSYLNPSTGRYEISVDIEAVEGGLSGTVGAQNISVITTPISGVNGVYNASATSGGSDIESQDALRIRIAARLSGNVIGTEDGYLSVVLANENVDDAAVVGHGDTDRDVAGAVDIFVKGRVSRYQQDSFSTAASTFPNLVLSKQPVLTSGVNTVLSSSSGSLGTGVWSLTKDTGAYAGSTQGLDSVVWSTAQSGSLGTVFVSYSYNGLIEDLQNLFAKTNKDVENVNLLVRWATEIEIDLTANVKIFAGYDSTDVVNQIRTDLATFFDALQIGDQVQQSDVVKAIVNVPGVDDVQLPFVTFRSSDLTVLQDSFGNLNLADNAYAISGTITINIVT